MKAKKNYVEGYGNDATVLSNTTKKTTTTENLTNAWAFYKQVQSTTGTQKGEIENDHDNDEYDGYNNDDAGLNVFTLANGIEEQSSPY